MLTALNIAIALGGSSSLAQEPAYDFQVAIPQFTQVADTTSLTAGHGYYPFDSVAVSGVSDKKVSVQFNNAKIADVMKWLGKQGVDFVFTTKEFNNQSISLNAVNRPLDEVVDSIGIALGGSWKRHGGTRIFTKDVFSQQFFGSSNDAARVFGVPGQSFQFNDKVMGQMLDEKKMKQWAEKLQKEAESMQFNSKINKLDAEKMAKELQEGPLKDLMKNLGEMRAQDGFTQENKSRFRSMPSFGLEKPLTLDTSKMSEFAKSLTKEQKALMKSQGFLQPKDLTDAQKKLIQLPSSGSFQIRFKTDDFDLVIKS